MKQFFFYTLKINLITSIPVRRITGVTALPPLKKFRPRNFNSSNTSKNYDSTMIPILSLNR